MPMRSLAGQRRWNMHQQVDVSTRYWTAFLDPHASEPSAVHSQPVTHQLDEPAGGADHVRNTSLFPVDGGHPVERQADGVGIDRSRPKVHDLLECKRGGPRLPVGQSGAHIAAGGLHRTFRGKCHAAGGRELDFIALLRARETFIIIFIFQLAKWT